MNHETIPLGVVNGLAKTMGLTKFFKNFSDLTVSFSSTLCESHSLDFFRKAVLQSQFLASTDLFVYFLYNHINDI